MSLSIDKVQNIESVAFISRCKYVTSRCKYVTQCYSITYPVRGNYAPVRGNYAPPSSEIVDPSEEIMGLTPPMENDIVIRIDPLSGNKE